MTSTGYAAKEEEYNRALADIKKRFPDIDEEKIKIPPRNTDQDIVILIAIFLGGLLLEGIVGSFLLGEVLAGGFIAGLGFAIAISLINVGGLGLGMGVVFDNFHRKKKDNYLVFCFMVYSCFGSKCWRCIISLQTSSTI